MTNCLAECLFLISFPTEMHLPGFRGTAPRSGSTTTTTTRPVVVLLLLLNMQAEVVSTSPTPSPPRSLARSSLPSPSPSSSSSPSMLETTRVDLSSSWDGFSSATLMAASTPSVVIDSELDNATDDQNRGNDDRNDADAVNTQDRDTTKVSLFDLPPDIMNRIYCILADKDFGCLLGAGKVSRQHVTEHLENLHQELCQLAQDPHPSALRRIIAAHTSLQSELVRSLMHRRCDGRSILWLAMKAGNIPFLRWMVDTKYYTAQTWTAFVKHALPFLQKYRQTHQATILRQFIDDTESLIPNERDN